MFGSSPDVRDAGFRPSPVAAEFLLAAHRLLRFAQSILVASEAVERRVVCAIRECGEAGNTHVDTNRVALRDRLFDLSLGLN